MSAILKRRVAELERQAAEAGMDGGIYSLSVPCGMSMEEAEAIYFAPNPVPRNIRIIGLINDPDLVFTEDQISQLRQGHTEMVERFCAAGMQQLTSRSDMGGQSEAARRCRAHNELVANFGDDGIEGLG